ncbi:hypothetical protein DPEC_G00238160 [Dallia pectoralis]|uniref:Uncharacterized protein n=1 Tax=Dallia pectoralis TaxID=75939 RepID=A0ACC2FYZ7_DALPE|nr:hypothetical protein DPEC_G00238160 [Dallia pectoralis]
MAWWRHPPHPSPACHHQSGSDCHECVRTPKAPGLTTRSHSPQLLLLHYRLNSSLSPDDLLPCRRRQNVWSDMTDVEGDMAEASKTRALQRAWWLLGAVGRLVSHTRGMSWSLN